MEIYPLFAVLLIWWLWFLVKPKMANHVGLHATLGIIGVSATLVGVAFTIPESASVKYTLAGLVILGTLVLSTTYFKISSSNDIVPKTAQQGSPQPVLELITKLREYQISWPDKWKPQIESGKLRKPQNAEISWYSDQIRVLLARITSEHITINSTLEKAIRDFSADAGKFGSRILEVFYLDWGADPMTYTHSIKQSFLEDGESLVVRLETIIAQLEEASFTSL